MTLDTTSNPTKNNIQNTVEYPSFFNILHAYIILCILYKECAYNIFIKKKCTYISVIIIMKNHFNIKRNQFLPQIDKIEEKYEQDSGDPPRDWMCWKRFYKQGLFTRLYIYYLYLR